MSIEQSNDNFLTARDRYIEGDRYAASVSERSGLIAETTNKVLAGLTELAGLLKVGESEEVSITTRQMFSAMAAGHAALMKAVGEGLTENSRYTDMLQQSTMVNKEDVRNDITAETGQIAETMPHVTSFATDLLGTLTWLHDAANRTTLAVNILRGGSQQIIRELDRRDFSF
jgi:hypothetical protein